MRGSVCSVGIQLCGIWLYQTLNLKLRNLPEQSDAGSERSDAGSEQSDAGSERPDAGAEWPDVGAERPDAGAERSDPSLQFLRP